MIVSESFGFAQPLSREAFQQRISDAFSATGEVKNEQHEGNDEQEVNEATGDMKGKSTAPEEQDKNSDDE